MSHFEIQSHNNEVIIMRYTDESLIVAMQYFDTRSQLQKNLQNLEIVILWDIESQLWDIKTIVSQILKFKVKIHK